MSFYLGIDIGGTNIACGVVDESFQIIARERFKTNTERGYNEILADIISYAKLAVKTADIDFSEIKYVGVGSPGAIDCVNGFIHYSNNLRFENIPLGEDLSKAFDKEVFVDNDANCAAVAEFFAGSARGAKNAVIITIGTGIGSGIIINSKLYGGSNNAGGEIGHTVISFDGVQCSCGRKGCFEAYCSATGLIRMTKEMCEQFPETIMNRLANNEGKFSARTAFNAMKLGDKFAEKLIDKYISYLACGIANIINTFQPDIISIGGGVCNEGDTLLVPLKNKIEHEIYAKNMPKNTEIVLCQLANHAGIIGAALLGKLNRD